MGIVVFGEMPSRSFYGFFDMKLPKTCSRRKEHSIPWLLLATRTVLKD